jgi:hypothetical protein
VDAAAGMYVPADFFCATHLALYIYGGYVGRQSRLMRSVVIHILTRRVDGRDGGHLGKPIDDHLSVRHIGHIHTQLAEL